MKKLWVNAVPYNKEIAIAALESGAQALVLADGDSDKVRQFGKIKTVEKNGDIKPGVDVEFIDIAGKEDEDKAAAVQPEKIVVLKMLDWTIIPIENLLARRGKNIMVQVQTSQQAKLMAEILEKGVDGVVLNTTDVNEIKKTAEIIHGITEKVALVTATITATKQLGMGDRSCLDTCTQMTVGQGILVGNTAAGFFLVHSESIENPYVASRPFRVNAGAVHAYTYNRSENTSHSLGRQRTPRRYSSQMSLSPALTIRDLRVQQPPCTPGKPFALIVELLQQSGKNLPGKAQGPNPKAGSKLRQSRLCEVC